MPLYTYECKTCGKIEDQFFRMDDFPDRIKCSRCGEQSRKVIVVGHGAIQCDSIVDVPWLASAVMNLQPDGERPVETRGQYKQYLREKNIIACG